MRLPIIRLYSIHKFKVQLILLRITTIPISATMTAMASKTIRLYLYRSLVTFLLFRLVF